MSNIQTHHANGREYLLIPIPEEHSDPRYFMIPRGLWTLAYTYGSPAQTCIVDLPEGTWKMLAFASSITEEEAAEMVEWWEVDEGGDPEGPVIIPVYKNYDLPFSFYTAKESLSSLLSSLGMGEGNTLILQKQ